MLSTVPKSTYLVGDRAGLSVLSYSEIVAVQHNSVLQVLQALQWWALETET